MAGGVWCNAGEKGRKIQLVAAKSTLGDIAHLLVISSLDPDDLLQDVSVTRSPGGITRHGQPGAQTARGLTANLPLRRERLCRTAADPGCASPTSHDRIHLKSLGSIQPSTAHGITS